MDSITQAAVPFFLGSLLLEVVVARVRKARVYRLNDSIADLALGSMSQITGLVWALFMIWVYALIGEHLSIQTLFGVPALPDGPLTSTAGIEWGAVATWLAAFVLIDHQYYWAHRTTHTYNIAWAAHVAHHSSPEYNLAVALRQSGSQSLVTMWFFFPLALVGFTWKHYGICFAINLIYQFWIHTRLIGRLGPLELVFNTPSHHRVHHGRNPKYIDKNHAGVFIVWDRLYGTFEPEAEEPIYGITTPIRSHNAVWANLHHYAWILSCAVRARGLADRVRMLFKPTGWRPDYLGGALGPKEPDPSEKVYDPPVPRAVAAYAVVQYGATVLFVLQILGHARVLMATPWGSVLLALALLFGVFSLSNVTSMFDSRTWMRAAELVRLAVAIAAAGALMADSTLEPAVAAPVMGFAAVSAAVWLSIQPRDRAESSAAA